MVEFILVACLVLMLIAVVLVAKLILPMRKPTMEEMTTYIQMMEKGGKMK